MGRGRACRESICSRPTARRYGRAALTRNSISSGSISISSSPRTLSCGPRLADQLYAVASSPGTVAHWESEPTAPAELRQVHWGFLESLPVERHQPWAELLVAHPALLDALRRVRAVANLYSRCRIGAPEAALQVLGAWAQLHSR